MHVTACAGVQALRKMVAEAVQRRDEGAPCDPEDIYLLDGASAGVSSDGVIYLLDGASAGVSDGEQVIQGRSHCVCDYGLCL